MCSIDDKHAKYGSDFYCNSCGMDLGFNPIEHNSELFCCKGCIQ